MNGNEIIPGSAADPNAKIRRVLIAGVSGYLGSALAVGLRNDFEVIGSYHRHPVRIEGVTSFQMNCLNGGEILECLRRYKPDAVIYCAGMSDHAYAETNAATAEGLHFKAPTVFFKILPVVLRFVFVSPDEAIGVLPASSTPFVETLAPGEPLTALARTKHQGENLTVGHKRYTAVMRTGEIFGEPFGWRALPHAMEPGDATPYHWMDLMLARLQKGVAVPLNPGMIRSFLYVGDFVRAMRRYLRAPPQEAHLYHLGATDAVSQFDFGRMLCEKLGYDPALVHKQKNVPPQNFALNPAKFSQEYDFQFQSIEEGLDEMAERLRTGFTRTWS